MAVEGKVRFWGDRVVGAITILLAALLVLGGMDGLTFSQFLYDLSLKHPKPEYSAVRTYAYPGTFNIPLRISDGSMVKFYWAFLAVSVLLLGTGIGVFRGTRTSLFVALSLPLFMSLSVAFGWWFSILVALYALLRLTNTLKSRKV